MHPGIPPVGSLLRLCVGWQIHKWAEGRRSGMAYKEMGGPKFRWADWKAKVADGWAGWCKWPWFSYNMCKRKEFPGAEGNQQQCRIFDLAFIGPNHLAFIGPNHLHVISTSSAPIHTLQTFAAASCFTCVFHTPPRNLDLLPCFCSQGRFD